MHRRLISLFALSLSLMISCAVTAEPSRFIKEVQAISERESGFLSGLKEKVVNDLLLEANAELIKRADQLKVPAFDFVAANMLYEFDPEASFRLQQRVIKALPQEPAVNLEWAMVSHRRGDIKIAITAYEKYFSGIPDAGAQWALIADCYVRDRRFPEAVAAWEKAKHGRNHTGIDFVIHSIYGDKPPLLKRAELQAKLNANDPSQWEALILQDLTMQDDWWNSHVFIKGLDRDLAKAQVALGKDSQRYQELAVAAALSREDDVTEAVVRDQLQHAHLIIEDGTFPVSSLVASRVVLQILNKKLVSAAELHKRFAVLLEKRAFEGVGDSEALNILCFLLLQIEDQPGLRRLDRLGRDRFKDQRYTVSYIAGLEGDGALTLDHPDFVKALAAFPEDAILQQYRLQLIGEARLTPDDLAAAIKAEYRHLSPGLAMRDSYTLKGYFARLEGLLKK